MELKDAKYLDSILMRGGTSAINVDDVPDNIIRMLATYRYIRIVDKRSDGIAYLIETTDEGGQFLARGGFQAEVEGRLKKEREAKIGLTKEEDNKGELCEKEDLNKEERRRRRKSVFNAVVSILGALAALVAILTYLNIHP